jgi:hypothetical protein
MVKYFVGITVKKVDRLGIKKRNDLFSHTPKIVVLEKQ